MRIGSKSKTAALALVTFLSLSMVTATSASAGDAAAAAPVVVAAVASRTAHSDAPAEGNVSAPAARTGSTGSGTATMRSSGTAASAETYWTAARMTRAVAPRTAVAIAAATSTAAAASTATATAAATATSPAGRTTPAPSSSKGAPITKIPAAAGTLVAAKPEPLRALVTRPYTNRPDRLNGKIFFTMAGVDYVCSGTIVNSHNKDMIDTAGHCVSDGAGHFATNWIFVPGYASAPKGGNAGRFPYGAWTARVLTTTAQWHNYGNLKQDVGYGVVAPLTKGHIAAYLGGQGSLFNASRNQSFSAFGYPQAAPFNGQDQRVSVSRRVGDDSVVGGLAGPVPLRIQSNLTGGASGGGWIVGISATTGLGNVNGHNSYRYVSGATANANQMYSPYYGNEALALYNYTKNL